MGAFCRRTFDKAEGGGSRHPVWSALDRNAIALGNGWDQVFAKGAILIVVGLPVPVVAGGAIVHVGRPAIDDGLALRMRFESHLRPREGMVHHAKNLIGGGAEAGDVVDEAREALAWGSPKLDKSFDSVGHGHEGQPAVGADEATIRKALRRVVEHLGTIVARAARRYGHGADQARKAQAAEVNA